MIEKLKKEIKDIEVLMQDPLFYKSEKLQEHL